MVTRFFKKLKVQFFQVQFVSINLLPYLFMPASFHSDFQATVTWQKGFCQLWSKCYTLREICLLPQMEFLTICLRTSLTILSMQPISSFLPIMASFLFRSLLPYGFFTLQDFPSKKNLWFLFSILLSFYVFKEYFSHPHDCFKSILYESLLLGVYRVPKNSNVR